MHKYFMRRMNEHLWSGIIHRSETGETRKEDDINLLDSDGLFEYIIDHYDHGERDTISSGSNESVEIYIHPNTKNEYIDIFYNLNEPAIKIVTYTSDLSKLYKVMTNKFNANYHINDDYLKIQTISISTNNEYKVINNKLFLNVLNEIIDFYGQIITLKRKG